MAKTVSKTVRLTVEEWAELDYAGRFTTARETMKSEGVFSENVPYLHPKR